MIPVLLVVLLVLCIVGLPVFPHSANWGYAPAGTVGLILVVLLVLLLLGRL